jgi:hypothetical protein
MEETMSSPQRDSRLYSVKSLIESNILVLKEETNLLLDHVVGVAGNKSFIDEIEDNIAQIAEYRSMLETIEKEFK